MISFRGMLFSNSLKKNLDLGNVFFVSHASTEIQDLIIKKNNCEALNKTCMFNNYKL